MNVLRMVSFGACLIILADVSHANNCTKGQPCGNSCISWSDVCHIVTPTPTVVNYPPVASYTIPQSSGVAPFSVVLDATYSYVTGAVINFYQWTASNGQTATGKVASITFANPGTYTITLTVTGSNGLTSTSQKTVTVTAPPIVATPPTTTCAAASFANGRLIIPALDVPAGFGQHTTYQVTMDYVTGSDPLEFELSGAVVLVSATGCQNPAYTPSTGVVGIPTVDVAGVGQYNVNLLLVPGTKPMRFRLQDATAK